MGLMRDSLVLATGTGCRVREPPPLSGRAKGARVSGPNPTRPRSTEILGGPLRRREKFSGIQKV